MNMKSIKYAALSITLTSYALAAEWEYIWDAKVDTPSEAGWQTHGRNEEGGQVSEGYHIDKDSYLSLPIEFNSSESWTIAIRARRADDGYGYGSLFTLKDGSVMVDFNYYDQNKYRYLSDEGLQYKEAPDGFNTAFHDILIANERGMIKVYLDGNEQPFAEYKASKSPSADSQILIGDFSSNTPETIVESVMYTTSGAYKPSTMSMPVSSKGASMTPLEVQPQGIELSPNQLRKPYDMAWPAEADAVVLDWTYATDSASSATLLIEAIGGDASSVAAFVMDPSLVTTAHQRFYSHFPSGANRVRLTLVDSKGSTGADFESVLVYPVKRLTWNDAVEREANFDFSYGMFQSFTIPDGSTILGIAFPITRMVMLDESNTSELYCKLYAGASVVAESAMSVGSLPLESSSHAVFFWSPKKSGGRTFTFDVSTNLQNRNNYYSDLLILQNWSNPYPGGSWGTRKRPERTWDTVFSIFTSVPLPNNRT